MASGNRPKELAVAGVCCRKSHLLSLYTEGQPPNHTEAPSLSLSTLKMTDEAGQNIFHRLVRTMYLQKKNKSFKNPEDYMKNVVSKTWRQGCFSCLWENVTPEINSFHIAAII